VKILVIEDDQKVSELLQKALEEKGYEVEVEHNGLTGLKRIKTEHFNMLITDIMLPDMDGISICKEIRQTKQDLPILMLTALGETDDKVDGLDAGADDYMVKPFEIRELYARIQAIFKRYKQEQKPELNYDDICLNLHTKRVHRNGVEINLTPKEFNLLAFMLRNPERVLSRTEISEKVWNTHFDTGTNFIDVYINYLRKKVDKNFDKKLIHTKPGMGFILKKEE
jgi:DNA-binding response OmpR family regulator